MRRLRRSTTKKPKFSVGTRQERKVNNVVELSSRRGTVCVSLNSSSGNVDDFAVRIHSTDAVATAYVQSIVDTEREGLGGSQSREILWSINLAGGARQAAKDFAGAVGAVSINTVLVTGNVHVAGCIDGTSSIGAS